MSVYEFDRLQIHNGVTSIQKIQNTGLFRGYVINMNTEREILLNVPWKTETFFSTWTEFEGNWT